MVVPIDFLVLLSDLLLFLLLFISIGEYLELIIQDKFDFVYIMTDSNI